jgi:hypothetical protein
VASVRSRVTSRSGVGGSPPPWRTSLSESDLATAEEQSLAKVVLEAGARLDDAGGDVTSHRPGVTLDDVVFFEDTGIEEGDR